MQDSIAALDLYREALDIYRGDFLAEPVYDEWCRNERERLRQRYLTAATRAAEILLGEPSCTAARNGERGPQGGTPASDPDEAARIAQQALAVDPAWEPACRLLMQSLLRRHEPSQALRAYERCAAALRADLDVAPAPETEALAAEARKASL